jgi:hypothetical protein
MSTHDDFTPVPAAKFDSLGRNITNHKGSVPAFTDQDIALALTKSQGRRGIAAKFLGCSTATLHYYINASPFLQSMLKEIDEQELDVAELSLLKQVRKGNVIALKYYLSCRGKHRGWSESLVLEGNVDRPVTLTADWNALPKEDLKAMRAMLAKAGAYQRRLDDEQK